MKVEKKIKEVKTFHIELTQTEVIELCVVLVDIQDVNSISPSLRDFAETLRLAIRKERELIT